MDKKDIDLIIETAVGICLKKYKLESNEYELEKGKDAKTVFTFIANLALKKYTYDPYSRLNEELFIKQNTINSIDRYMLGKANENKQIYRIIEDDLMKTLNITCRIRKEKFANIEDIEDYKILAILKTLETYDESINKSINLYANDWFMAFVNKEVTEDSKTLVLK